jgi:hypothetical protein
MKRGPNSSHRSAADTPTVQVVALSIDMAIQYSGVDIWREKLPRQRRDLVSFAWPSKETPRLLLVYRSAAWNSRYYRLFGADGPSESWLFSQTGRGAALLGSLLCN